MFVVPGTIMYLCIHESIQAEMLARSCLHISHAECEVFVKFKGKIRYARYEIVIP
jgi:hypothetical protein